MASAYGRYGYRRGTALLHAEGWRVNHKRVERIWRQEGLKVPKRQPKRSRLWFNDGSCVRRRAEYPDHVWSYDFVLDRTQDGRVLLVRRVRRGRVMAGARGAPRETDVSWFDISNVADLSADGRSMLIAEFGEAAGARSEPGGRAVRSYLRTLDGTSTVDSVTLVMFIILIVTGIVQILARVLMQKRELVGIKLPGAWRALVYVLFLVIYSTGGLNHVRF